MGFLSGPRLTAAAFALMALAGAAALRVALSGNLAFPPGPRPGGAFLPPETILIAADAAERRGDLTAAIAHYRAAVERKPQLVDRRSREFLGAEFEGKIGIWIAGLKNGKIPAGPTALPDASYLFRRMYGGCG